MMKWIKLLPKKGKKGFTLVELVLAVVILSLFALGIITLLTASSTKIQKNADNAAIHSEAVQKLDVVIAALSHGGYDVSTQEKVDAFVTEVLGADHGATLTMSVPDEYKYTAGESSEFIGWELNLTYKGVTVRGFASHTEGVFDKVVDE